MGWAETPYWAGRDTEDARRLAPLWMRYRDEAFAAELARGLPPVGVLPISETLRESSEILPYEALKAKVEAQSFCAVGNCSCRQMKRYAGEGCDHSLENCLHFGDMARYRVEQGTAREISTEETLKILRESNEEGLVHVSDNLSDDVSEVDDALCIGCGVCTPTCPEGAVDLVHRDEIKPPRTIQELVAARYKAPTQ